MNLEKNPRVIAYEMIQSVSEPLEKKCIESDWNLDLIHRVSVRMGLVSPQGPRQTWEALQTLLPPEESLRLFQKLTQMAESLCLKENPKCEKCEMNTRCAKNI